MEISTTELTRQFEAAVKRWPFLRSLEKQHGLPPLLMFAVGSRETNLGVQFTQGSTGDNGHGHGVWQLDDRFHVIPPGFDTDVRAQAESAAEMLAGLRTRFGDWLSACNAYNSGRPQTSATTGKNYGPDVLERREALVLIATQQGLLATMDAVGPPEEEDAEMFIANITGLNHPQLIGAGWRKAIRSGHTATALLTAGVKHLGLLDASVATDLIDLETLPAALAGIAGGLAEHGGAPG